MENTKRYIIIVSIILFCFIVFFMAGYFKHRENRANMETFVSKNVEQFKECDTSSKIYDLFYSNIYDELFRSTARNQYEVLQIRELILSKYKLGPINILDLGCGLGHHVDLFTQYKYNCVGLDISKHMLNIAKVKYPLLEFKQGNMTDRNLYTPGSFSHITCFFYSVYYVEDILLLFSNVNTWLSKGGHFIIHVVDKRKFDPVLEKGSGLIPLYNPQRFGHKTQTQLTFNTFKYTADWNLSKVPVIFSEIFKFNEGQVRKNFHKLYMYTMKKIVDTAEKAGFKLTNTVDLALVNQTYNYLFCFEKKHNILL